MKTILVLLWLVAFVFGTWAIIYTTQKTQYITPGYLIKLLKERCDQEKIMRLRNYDCPATITPILHYKDGSLDYITCPKSKAPKNKTE